MEVLENPEQSVSTGSQQLVGTANWGTATLAGFFTGLLYGGSKEATASASKDAEVMLKLGSTPDKREQHRLMRDAMEKRFIRVTRGSIVGGLRLGVFAGSFVGLQNLLAEKRGVHDVFNVVAAGSATAATFGLISKYAVASSFMLKMPGSVMWRLRNVAIGSALGAAFGFPLGWLHLKLVEKANEDNLAANPRLEANSGIDAAIERLEENLRKK
ncbi:hypothetical protein ACFE04_016757 [Oxalis oulophora]